MTWLRGTLLVAFKAEHTANFAQGQVAHRKSKPSHKSCVREVNVQCLTPRRPYEARSFERARCQDLGQGPVNLDVSQILLAEVRSGTLAQEKDVPFGLGIRVEIGHVPRPIQGRDRNNNNITQSIVVASENHHPKIGDNSSWVHKKQPRNDGMGAVHRGLHSDISSESKLSRLRSGPKENAHDPRNRARSTLIQVKGWFRGSWRLVRGKRARRRTSEARARVAPHSTSPGTYVSSRWWGVAVLLEPPRAGEGRTREGSRRKSIQALESLCAMMPPRAAFRQEPQRTRAPWGTEGRRRTRAERTSSREGMS